MSRDTWYKCDPSDLLDAFVELADPAMIAMYAAVINRIYQSGGPISNSETHLGSLVGLKPRKARNVLDQLLAIGKLFLVDGRLMQSRCQRELTARNGLSKARAEAGAAGGKARGKESVSSQSQLSFERNSDENGVKSERSREIQPQETAENRQSDEAIASYARAREEENREETPLPPANSPGGYVTPKPDFSKPIELHERGGLVLASSLSDRRDRAGLVVDLPSLTSRIMLEARMAVPPSDLPLVDSWVRMGADPDEDILPIVIRLAATSRGPIRGMRYFDNEIRTVFDAKKALNSTQTAYFERITRQAQAKMA